MRDFAGSAVIISGSGTGIGREVAIKFANAGATVACLSKTIENAQETVRLAGPNSFAVKCDVKDYVAVEDSIRFSVAEMGKVDVLINTAGINSMQHTHLQTPHEFDNIISTNLNGSFYTSRYTLPFMINQNYGCIINTTSLAYNTVLPWSAAYVASKAGVVGLTKELAYEYKKNNIRVNAVSPGGVQTPFIDKQKLPDNADFNLLTRFIDELIPVQDVAEMYLYIASDPCKNITGAIFNIDRGGSL